MDRLSAVVAFVLASTACACDQPGGDSAAEPATGRVDAVRANVKKSKLADLCDIAPEPAKPYTWPLLDANATVPAELAGSRYRWVNVWATWCKPCVEELPLLARTFKDWQAHNQAVTLTLLSIDADARVAQDFIRARAELPQSLALKDPGAAADWLRSLGLAAGSSIPVHIVLDAHDKLVCARSGGISAPDLERFQRAMFP